MVRGGGRPGRRRGGGGKEEGRGQEGGGEGREGGGGGGGGEGRGEGNTSSCSLLFNITCSVEWEDIVMVAMLCWPIGCIALFIINSSTCCIHWLWVVTQHDSPQAALCLPSITPMQARCPPSITPQAALCLPSQHQSPGCTVPSLPASVPRLHCAFPPSISGPQAALCLPSQRHPQAAWCPCQHDSPVTCPIW